MNLLPVTIVILNICVMIGVITLTVFVVAALSWVIRDIFFENSRKNDKFYKPYAAYTEYNEEYNVYKKEQENDVK